MGTSAVDGSKSLGTTLARELTGRAQPWRGQLPAVRPSVPLKEARSSAILWAQDHEDEDRILAARGFVLATMQRFLQLSSVAEVDVTPLPPELEFTTPGEHAQQIARDLGQEVAGFDRLTAAYWLSVTYTSLLPPSMRGRLGIYYTPPALSARLMDMATEAGVDWRSARILDPACGGGAFLAPAAARMIAIQRDREANEILEDVAARLRGFEIDGFAAWMSQVFLEITMAEVCRQAGARLPQLVSVCDSLEIPAKPSFDLVIGNPPYGRITLRPELRERFARSLYGHANLYGVFTDLALRWCTRDGVIAYVTPTSFLAGEYFKGLRELLATEAPPVAIDFVADRTGVFEGVQQETLLATYRRHRSRCKIDVHHLAVTDGGQAAIIQAGRFELPSDQEAPWPLPRLPEHQALVRGMAEMPTRLSDLGYTVSTGPLVWNRYKKQLRKRPSKLTVPLIWSEAVAGPGRFVFRAEKKNHEPYFKMEDGDEWLRVTELCVLLQRTTAKEQSRRLIAARLSESLLEEHGAVTVENHLNMVRPVDRSPAVSLAVVETILNSRVVDEAFRCISGSVAVSAYELESLPVPTASELDKVAQLLDSDAEQEEIERYLREIYIGGQE